MTSASVAGPRGVEAFLLAAQDAGAGLHPLDRALALVRLASVSGDGDAADWPIARRDQALLTLARRLFGDAMPCLATCPACGEAQEFDLSANAAAEAIAAPVEEVLAIDGWQATFAPLTSRDLAAMARSADGAAVDTLADRAVSIVRQDGAMCGLPALDGDARGKILARLESREAAGELLLTLDCPECGHGWAERFDVGGWLWERIETAGRAIIGEVAVLARAFGWTEREILSLPRRRRLAYLERIAG